MSYGKQLGLRAEIGGVSGAEHEVAVPFLRKITVQEIFIPLFFS